MLRFIKKVKSFLHNYSLYLFCVGIVLVRNLTIDYFIRHSRFEYKPVSGYLSLLIIKNELIVLSFFFVLTWLIIYFYQKKYKKTYYLLIGLLLFFIFTYILDLGSMLFFGIRFHLLKYMRNVIFCKDGMIILSFFSIAAFLFIKKLSTKTILPKMNFKKVLLFSLIPVIGVSPINSSINSKKVNFDIDYVTANFIKINSEINYFIPFLNYQLLLRKYDNYFTTEPGLSENKNVILVISESLSAMNSYRTSHIFNRLPNIDNISKEGIFFTRMIAEGFGTRFGLHSLLEGDFTFGGILGGFYFKEKYNMPLAKIFNKRGYETYFITAGPLSFNRNIKLVTKCGFKNIIDNTDKYFKNFKTYSFESPPDETLYNLTINKVKKEIKNKNKFFMTLLTISGHIPYITPYGRGEDKTYHYIDDAFAIFYKNLKKTGFFKNGILIVVGDHRQFAPLKNEEIKRYGDKYYGRIVCFIIGKDIKPQINNNFYMQNDIYYSLAKHFWKGKIKLFKFYNDVFTGEIRRNFAITYLPTAKSCLLVYTPDGIGKIKLQGKWTRFIEVKNISKFKQFLIVKMVNILRNYQLSKAYHLIE